MVLSLWIASYFTPHPYTCYWTYILIHFLLCIILHEDGDSDVYWNIGTASALKQLNLKS
jgi:hypothetical protein